MKYQFATLLLVLPVLALPVGCRSSPSAEEETEYYQMQHDRAEVEILRQRVLNEEAVQEEDRLQHKRVNQVPLSVAREKLSGAELVVRLDDQREEMKNHFAR